MDMDALIPSLSTTSTASLIGWTLAACLLLTNAKSLPLAHSLRLLPSLYRLFRPRLFGRPNPGKGIPTAIGSGASRASAALFSHYRTSSRAVPFDLDVNLHKSNSTFFADADISRAALLTKLLSQGLASLSTIPLLAAVQCSFKREIKPLQAYDVSSRILTWDDKSLWVVTYFLQSGFKLPADVEVFGGKGVEGLMGDKGLRRGVFAVMVSRYVCKKGRETVEPGRAFRAAGLLVDGDGKDGLVDGEKVEVARRNGLKYLEGCML